MIQPQKNATPRQIAVYTAVLNTVVMALIAVPLIILGGFDKKIIYVLAFLLLTFFFTYAIFLNAIKKYIYRRVKLIYKTIHSRKLSAKEKRDVVDADENVIGEVEKDVVNWVQDKENELEEIKIESEYRRQFVGDISHELKTPIFIIQSYLDMLIEGGWKEEATCLKFLNKAAKSTERLVSIVEDLEAIAKLESGGMLLDMQVFDIKQVTQSIFEELELRAAERDISLLFKDGASKSFSVYADPEKVKQVLTNLIVNSIKYGKEGGRTKVSFYDMDQRVLIEVADTGVGIPEGHRKRIFDRFYRVEKSRSRAQGGSGLGLSIVKHIIEAHNQTINVRSTPGKGSTFGFTLQMAK